MSTETPILVEVVRGDMIESFHLGSMVVVDAKGSIIKSWGSPGQNIYARSALKFLQALPLIETGAAETFALKDEEIVLACASHAGSPEHTQHVTTWLERLGLSAADLECGATLPIGEKEARNLIASGVPHSAVHHGCSGNHAAFLSTALHMKENPKGYIDRNHPVQQRVESIVSEMAEVDLISAPTGRDGCGIPVYGFPLTNLAHAMAKFANPQGLPSNRVNAIHRIMSAVKKYPRFLAGEGRFDTALIEATQGEVIIKGGAEGVYMAVIPALGYGAALKIMDGSGYAAEVAIGALLKELGVLTKSAQSILESYLNPPLKFADKIIGGRRAVLK